MRQPRLHDLPATAKAARSPGCRGIPATAPASATARWVAVPILRMHCGPRSPSHPVSQPTGRRFRGKPHHSLLYLPQSNSRIGRETRQREVVPFRVCCWPFPGLPASLIEVLALHPRSGRNSRRINDRRVPPCGRYPARNRVPRSDACHSTG